MDFKALDFETLKVDRTQFTVARLGDPDDALSYWLTRPIGERLQGIELLCRTLYGYTDAYPRLQRVLEIAQLPRS